VDNDWLQHSPVTRIKRIPGGGHLPAWTDAQYQHAVAHLPEHLRRVVVLARCTGQRRGDLIALTWANYDGSAIRLRQQKGRKHDEMRIPLLPEARAELDAWKRDATSTFILTTDRGVPWNPTYLSRLIGEAVVAIGLPKGLNVHGLRKLAATTLAEAGCSTHEIMAITGHTTLSMVELYTASARQEQLATAAIVRLGDHRKQPA
jgi:integrase